MSESTPARLIPARYWDFYLLRRFVIEFILVLVCMYFVERFWGSTTYIVWLWVIAFGFALLNTSASQGLTYGVVQVDAEGVVIKNRLRPPLPWAELSAVHIGLAPNDAVLYVKFMLANGMKVNLFHRDGLNDIANAIGEFAPEGVTIHRQGAGWLWRLLMPWRK